jgi:hypothetical protein
LSSTNYFKLSKKKLFQTLDRVNEVQDVPVDSLDSALVNLSIFLASSIRCQLMMKSSFFALDFAHGLAERFEWFLAAVMPGSLIP